MTNLAFGRFTPYHTVIHKLDPRNKIIMMILLIVAVFLRVDSYSSTLILSGFLLVITLLMMLLARVSILSLLRTFLSMWFLLLFLLVFFMLSYSTINASIVSTLPEEHILFRIGTLGFYYDAFYQFAYISIRIILTLMITMILTSTTSPMNLTYGFEWYMTPLKLVKFPAHIVAMTLSIALRFIPTLIDETNRIIKAQASRGVDFQKGGLIKKFRAIISLIIPLFVSAINRSEELSNAMEARGYDPYAKRSRYRELHFHFIDLAAFLLVIAIFGGILTLVIIDKNYMKVDLIKWLFNVDAPF